MPTSVAKARGQLKPAVHARLVRRAAQLGIILPAYREPEGAA